jgi:glycosyltransferase involved in cell wall biosynthesis
VSEARLDGIPFRHVGAAMTELEPMRSRPRRVLTEMLDEYDLVQIVSGTPAIARATRTVRPPVMLQVATTFEAERAVMFAAMPPMRRALSRVMTRYMARLDRIGAKHARAIFTENAWMHELLSTWYPGRVQFAPPGVDTTLFAPPSDGSERRGGPIMFVGRMNDPRKNVRLLLDAYALLRARMPNAPRLLLAGLSGPYDEDIRHAESIGIAPHLDVRLDPSATELAELYRGASAFALPSNEEGLGVVVLEAMASGLPVVATRCGGPDHVVLDDETGYLVPLGDALAMADRLARILGDDDRRIRFGRAGRARALAEYSLHAAGRRFLDTYDAVLGATSA